MEGCRIWIRYALIRDLLLFVMGGCEADIAWFVFCRGQGREFGGANIMI